MKILLILSNAKTSNASSIQIKSLIPYLHNPFIYYCPENIHLLSIKQYKTFLPLLQTFDQSKQLLFPNEIQHIQEIHSLLSSKQIDLILTWSNPYTTSTLGLALALLYNIPIILRLGDFYISKYQPENKKLREYSKANRIIVPNDKLKQKLISFYGPSFDKKIYVIPQHFHTLYSPLPSPQINKNKIKLIHTGNMYENRKITPIILLLSKLPPSFKSIIEIQFIGCHQTLDIDQLLCKSHHIQADFSLCYPFENWFFENAIPHDKLTPYLLNADILLHIEYLSQDNHFLSFKLIDYLSYQKPIFTFTQKNSPNHHLAQECGFAFGDIENLEQSLTIFLNLIQNPQQYIPNSEKIKKYHISSLKNQWYHVFQHSCPIPLSI